jgi:hypothetical protein
MAIREEQIRAATLALEMRHGREFCDKVRELIDHGAELDSVILNHLLERNAERDQLDSQTIELLLTRTHSLELYSRTKERFYARGDSMSRLLAIDEFRADVQPVLCKKLYLERTNFIGHNLALDQLAKHATADALKYLEAIVSEEKPEQLAKTSMADAVHNTIDLDNLSTHLEEVRYLVDEIGHRNFLEKVCDAIDTIRRREAVYDRIGLNSEAHREVPRYSKIQVIFDTDEGIDPEEVARVLASRSEGRTAEFKASFRVVMNKDGQVDGDQNEKRQNALRYEVLKTITAFLNADGGMLLVGVDDSARVIGLAPDLQHYGGKDKLLNDLSTLVKQKLEGGVFDYVRYGFARVEKQEVLAIKCLSHSGGCYFKNEKGKSDFYLRNGAADQLLEGKELGDHLKANRPNDKI